MATNLAIDDTLIAAAVKMGHHKTKKAAVTVALEEYIQRHQQQELLNLFGRVEYQADYDYKKQRNQE